MGRLEGKTALVTGGASGIGEAICRRLSQEGAWVAVADLNEVKGVKLARELGKGSLFVKLDVTQEAEWQTAIDTVTSQFGGLDILVNNAGMMKPGTIEDATLADWRAAMTVNGEGVFLGCKAAIGSMKTRGADQAPAAIVNVASTMAIRAQPMHAVYSATKAAVQMLSKSAAVHCARAGYRIRINCVLPGAIDTELLRGNIKPGQTEDDYFTTLKARYPTGRIGTPADIANGVVFLVSDDADFMTGADLLLDGGSTA